MPKERNKRDIIPEYIQKPSFEQYHTGKFKHVPGRLEKAKDIRAEILKVNKGIYYRYKLYEIKTLDMIIEEYRQDENKKNLIRDMKDFIAQSKPNKDN